MVEFIFIIQSKTYFLQYWLSEWLKGQSHQILEVTFGLLN